jgi:hypothetical protein
LVVRRKDKGLAVTLSLLVVRVASAQARNKFRSPQFVGTRLSWSCLIQADNCLASGVEQRVRFLPAFICHLSLQSAQSSLIDNLTYAQHRGSLRKVLQLSLFRETPERWRHLVGGFLGRFAWQSCLPGKEAVMNLLQEPKQYLASQWSIGLFTWITR